MTLLFSLSTGEKMWTDRPTDRPFLRPRHSEERAHGVTMEVAHKRIELSKRVVTLLDAPGHQDFIPQVCFEVFVRGWVCALLLLLRNDEAASLSPASLIRSRDHTYVPTPLSR